MDLKPFQLPHKILLGAGPSNCSQRVLSALSMQTLIPLDEETENLAVETRELIKKIFVTENKLTFAQQTSGSGGMETAIVNLVEPGQKIVVAVAGSWGERAAVIAEKYNIEVVRLQVEDGEVYTLETLETAVKEHRPVMLWMSHGESSSGVLQPLEGVADICQKYDCLLAVDAIISIGAVPVLTDEWKLDVAVGATQKAIGAPAGFALMTLSARAEKVLKERKNTIPFYFDIKGLALFWMCYGGNIGYHYTMSTNMIAALREAISEKLEEGLENVWERHRKVSVYFSEKMAEIGMRNFVEKPENRLANVTTFVIPEDIDWKMLYTQLYYKYNICFGFGIGPTANKAIRVGLMGSVNCNFKMADYAVQCFKAAMDDCRNNRHVGGTVNAVVAYS